MEITIDLLWLMIIFCFLLIIHFTLIDNAKKKASLSSWKSCRKDFADRMVSASYWFKGNNRLHNFICLFSHYMKEFDGLDVDLVRKKLDKLGDKNVHELPVDEMLEYFPKK